MESKRRSLADVLVPIALLAFWFAVARALMGLPMGDDSWYMLSARTVHPTDFIHLQQWGPLYLTWLRLLESITPNRVHVYFVDWTVLATLLVLIPTVSRVRGAWIYALAITVLPILSTIPLPGLFGGVLLVLGFTLFLKTSRTFLWASLIACLTSFVAAFARPEFSYSVFASATCVIIVSLLQFRRAKNAHQSSRLPLIATMAAIACACAMLFVIHHSPQQRSGFAFVQHFLKRAQEDGKIPGYDEQYALQKFGLQSHVYDFGDLTTGDFFRANPKLFLSHLLENFLDPRTWLVLLALAAIFLYPWLRASAREFRAHSVYLALMCLAPIGGIITIYPRAHYYVLFLPAVILFVVIMCRPHPKGLLTAAIAILAGCTAIAFFQLRVQPRRDDYLGMRMRRDLRRVQCMQAIDATLINRNAVFEASDGTGYYLLHDRPVERTRNLPTWISFQQWVADNRPSMITTDEAVLQHFTVTQSEVDSFLLGQQHYTPRACMGAASMNVYVLP